MPNDDLDRLVSDGGVAYAYDAAMSETRTDAYGYNVRNELTSATKTGGPASVPATPEYAYQYDDIGNRITSTDLGTNRTYTANSLNQYSAITTSDLGLQTSSFEPQFDADGIFAEGYAYDALGRRAATTTREGTTRHVYDDGWQMVADVDAGGNVLASYVWGEGIDRLLAVKIGEATYYPLTDVQGTVWGYVDSSNDTVARWQYDAWGNVVDESVSVPALATLRYRFQGREWSAATGLVNFRMRWYYSETGRWLSKDPIGLLGGINVYIVCRNNPLSLRDPSGLVDMNLFSLGDELRSYAELNNPSDVFSVGAHGNENGVYYRRSDGEYERIPVRRLARMIQNDPRYHRQPVQLDSCNVGNGHYPQELSNILGVEVRAPTRYAWYDATGNVDYFGMTGVRHKDFLDPGELKSFKPSIINSFLAK